MTIERGVEWGVARPLPETAPVASSDAALGELAAQTGPSDPIGVVGGNLARTLGATGDRARLYGSAARTVTVDAMAISIDGAPPRLAVAQLVVGSRRWMRFVVVANAAWLGKWNINPRSHPNDGRIEAIDVRSLSLNDRLKARKRLPVGAHVPHPDISVRSVATFTLQLPRPTVFTIDDHFAGRGVDFTVSVLTDRLTVVV